MKTKTMSAALGLIATFFMLGGQAMAQCPSGSACTEYLGQGKKGSFFRLLVPDAWDGDLFVINHGFDLNPLNISAHHVCQNTNPLAAPVTCASDADCTGISVENCNEISTMGFEDILIPDGKAVAAPTYSQTGWSVFQSRKDIKDILKFMKKEPAIGRPDRVIVSGFSMGGAVTVDAIMRMKRGKDIHGAIPLCPCSGGGGVTWDIASDLRAAYDYLCDSVPGGFFASPHDVGEATMGELTMALKMNKCMGIIFPDSDPIEAAAQIQRRDDFVTMTGFSGTVTGGSANLLTVGGYAVLGMGDLVDDKKRLHGKRFGWNEGLDYSVIGSDPVLAAAFDAAVPRLTPGKGRKKLAKNTLVSFLKGKAKKVNYPIMSLAGNQDWVCIPEFQKFLADTATEGGKELEQIWGSAAGHCQYTPFEIEAVVREYFDWLDTFDPINHLGEDRPDGASTEARCLALSGATPADCNFDNAFTPPALNTRMPPRADWPEVARNPLP